MRFEVVLRTSTCEGHICNFYQLFIWNRHQFMIKKCCRRRCRRRSLMRKSQQLCRSLINISVFFFQDKTRVLVSLDF